MQKYPGLAIYFLFRLVQGFFNRNEPGAYPMFNFSQKKVGGIRFIKLGRFCFSFCVTQQYKALI